MVLEIILAVSAGTAFVAVLAACVCGCRKDTHKSELVGTAGVVKLRFDEEIAHPSQNSPIPSKRVSSQNSHRSLPEIPPSLPVQDSGDTASDLYATVGIAEQRTSERNSPNINRQSSQSYEHEYARLQNGLGTNEPNKENEKLVGNSTGSLPLLSVQSNESPQSSEIVITASNAISGQVSSSRELPYMTPPVISTAATSTETDNQIVVHQSNQHFSGDSVDSAKGYTSITVREPLSFIRPVISANLRNSQPHYTTVSDDSDEMYAAIEEPANQVYTSESETYAQIQPPNVQPQNLVAVDLISTSTSSNVASLNAIAPNASICNVSNITSEGTQINLKRTNQDSSNNPNIQKHVRQASNSSHPESVGALGSPKPEKRQANSPLPPPPPSTADTISTINVAHKKTQDSPSHHKKSSKHHKISSTGNLHENDKLRRSVNEKHQRNNSCVSSSDFYGCNYPVDKHRFSSGDLVRPLVARELNFSLDKPTEQKQIDAIYNTIDGPNDIYAAIDQEPSRNNIALGQSNFMSSPIKNVEEMYAKVIKKSKHSAADHHSQPITKQSNYEDLNISKTEYNANIQSSRKKVKQDIEKRYSGSNIASVTQENSSINGPGRILSVQLLEKDDPGYETIDKSKSKSHGYETISKIKTPKSSDPGYETVKELNKNVEHKKTKNIPTVSGGLMQHSHNSIDIIQRITLHEGRTSPINEPGYESVPSGPDSLLSNDPGYEHIRRLEKYASDLDPNYEQLRLRNSTPPYASIRNKSQNNVPGYSVINKVNKTVDQNWLSNNNESYLSEPNYESMPHEPAYNTGSESDPNYESVGPKDPNYESVKYFNVSHKEPPYEKVKNDTNNSDISQFQRTSSSSSYEKIKPIQKNDKNNDDNNDNRRNGSSLSFVAENGSVGDYFQV